MSELQRPQDGVEAWVTSPVTALLKKHRDVIEIVAKGVLDEARVMRLIRAAILRDPNILQCTPVSVLNAVLHVTYLGLEVAPEQAYLLAFKSRKDGGKMVCTPVIDYRGKIRVAANSGVIFDDPLVIYANEPFKYWTDENGTHFHHEPMVKGVEADRGAPIAAYVVTRLNGVAKVSLMRGDEILAIKKAAIARGSAPWQENEMRMWCKTVVHRAFKTLPRPTDPDAADRVRRTQEIDDANDMGELPEALIVDPDAELAGPMVSAGSHEEQQTVAERRIAEATAATQITEKDFSRGESSQADQMAERYEREAAELRAKVAAQSREAEQKVQAKPAGGFSFGRRPGQ